MLTVAVLLATAATTALALHFPGMPAGYGRTPAIIEHAEYWRLLTSLLVHDGGPTRIAFNFCALVLVGTLAEWRASRTAWATAYLAGGLVGELVGPAWQPIGAGAAAGWVARPCRTGRG